MTKWRQNGDKMGTKSRRKNGKMEQNGDKMAAIKNQNGDKIGDKMTTKCQNEKIG